MKKLLTLALLLITTPCFAWKLSWDALPGATEYHIEYSVSPLISPTELIATSTSYDLDILGLNPGTRYEFAVKACVGSPPSCYAESDHIRWTMPSTPIIVEMPPEEKVINVIIQRD